MRRLPLRLAVLLLLPLGVAAAAERFGIALPDTAGRVSLGIFDGSGRLVRGLAACDPVGNLLAGLDGLVFEWDGRDDTGNRAAPGRYRVAGWFVPDGIEAKGEAFRFNDWVPAAGPPEIARIDAVVPLEGTGFALVGARSDRPGLAVWTCNEHGAPAPAAEFPWAQRLLAADRSGLLMEGAEGCFLTPPPGLPGAASSLPGPPPTAAALHAGRPVLLRDGHIDPAQPAPEGTRLLAAWAGGVAASDGRRVWSRGPAGWTEVPLGEDCTVWSVAAGHDGSLWMACRPDSSGAPCVREYALSGELLRQLELDPSTKHARVFADPARLRFFVLSEEPQRQRVLAIEPHPAEGEAPHPGWHVTLDHSIWWPGNPGFRDGEAVVDAGGTPQDRSLRIRLSPNLLNRSPGTLEVSLIGDSWHWLAARDGLKLLPIAPNRGPAVLTRGSAPDAVRVLVSTPPSAEEYAVGDLRKVAPLDGGEIELP